MMSSDEVRAALATLGYTQRGFAREIGANERTPRRWCDDGADGVPAYLLRTLLAHAVTPPPETLAVEQDRDGPCGEALDPHLDALRERAERAGWHPAEIVAATIYWTKARMGCRDVQATQQLDKDGNPITPGTTFVLKMER